ncbi:hypothetical protein AB0C76_26595 [Kitasatospora sp. NPDC048722]|uniref:hypothetical protein n=1 Tax=Kitasatospora sp. NPDC048722 TaxID=3155639 RepID=UPI0033E0A02C
MSENTAADLDRLRAALLAGAYEHRVRTVMHRWYSGYEAPHMDLEHQGELVTEDFTMHRPPESGMPSVQGRQAYLDSVSGADPNQRNAHHLRSLAIEHTGTRTAKAVVTHDFETVGPAMNGAALLRYDLELLQDPTERLPRIRALGQRVLSHQEVPFTEAYTENRVLAFVHYWLSLLELPAPDAEPLRELLHTDLTMTLSDGRVLHTFDQVAAWYTENAGLVAISTHHLADLTITPAADNTLDLSVDFAWEGITRAGQPVVARTRHHWNLAETGERYLRLRRFAVTVLDPFTHATAQEARAHHDANKTD